MILIKKGIGSMKDGLMGMEFFHLSGSRQLLKCTQQGKVIYQNDDATSVQGIKTEEFVGEYSSETIKELGVTNHETSALTFFLRIIEWMRANY